MRRFALSGGALCLGVLAACGGGGESTDLEPAFLPAEQEQEQELIPDDPDQVRVVKLNDTGVVWGGSFPRGKNASCIGETISQQDCSLGRDLAYSDDGVGHHCKLNHDLTSNPAG